MQIYWKRHARQRFFERSLIYGVHYGEIELNIIKQKVKIKQPFGTVKTIFELMNYFFTVIKKEDKKRIKVISIWESNDEEIELWKKK
ncbi:MAG: hypothetical protein ABH821_04925 [archaeon]